MKVLNAIKFGAISAILSLAGNANENFSQWGALLGATFQAGVNNDQANINRSAIGGRFFSDYFEAALAFQRGVEAFNDIVQGFNYNHNGDFTQPLFNGINVGAPEEPAEAPVEGQGEGQGDVPVEESGWVVLNNMHAFLDPRNDADTRRTLSENISTKASVLTELIAAIQGTLTTYSGITLVEDDSRLSEPLSDLTTLIQDLGHVTAAATAVIAIGELAKAELAQMGNASTDQCLVDILNTKDQSLDNKVKVLETLVRIILAKVSDMHAFVH
jgi:hypothetical protein